MSSPFKSEAIRLESREPIEFIEITPQVGALVRKSGVANGLVVVSSQHTTAGIRINEKCPELEQDLKTFFAKLADPAAFYHHNRVAGDGRPNAHSHLLSFLIGSSETIAIREGHLLLGSWQKIFFVELDGPRGRREVQVTVIGV